MSIASYSFMGAENGTVHAGKLSAGVYTADLLQAPRKISTPVNIPYLESAALWKHPLILPFKEEKV